MGSGLEDMIVPTPESLSSTLIALGSSVRLSYKCYTVTAVTPHHDFVLHLAYNANQGGVTQLNLRLGEYNQVHFCVRKFQVFSASKKNSLAEEFIIFG